MRLYPGIRHLLSTVLAFAAFTAMADQMHDRIDVLVGSEILRVIYLGGSSGSIIVYRSADGKFRVRQVDGEGQTLRDQLYWPTVSESLKWTESRIELPPTNSYGLYSTGYISTSSGKTADRDLIVRKDDGDGEVWTYTYNGSASDADEGRALYLKGNLVYVVGLSTETTTGKDMFVACLNAETGAEVWSETIHRTGSTSDEGLHIVADETGAYAGGFSEMPGLGKDFLAAKVSSAGAPVWQYTFNRAGFDDQAERVALNSRGVWFAGQSSASNAVGGRDLGIQLLDPSTGSWLEDDFSNSSQDMFLHDVALRPDGFLIYAGEVGGDLWFAKSQASGIILISTGFINYVGDIDLEDMAIDAQNQMYFASSMTNGGTRDWVVTKLSDTASIGTRLVTTAVDGAVRSISVDSRQNLWLGGFEGTNGVFREWMKGVSTMTFNPNPVVGGNPTTASLTLSDKAPVGGFSMSLQAPGFTPAAPITIPEGQDSGTTTLPTYGTGGNAAVSVYAVIGSKLAGPFVLNIQKAALTGLSMNPSRVFGGAPSTGTVTLNGKSGDVGLNVTLSDNTSIIETPASMTIPQQSTSGTFVVATTNTISSSATRQVTATAGAVTKTANLTVDPGLNSLTLNPTTVKGGLTTTGTVALKGVAPNGGSVALSKNSSAITVPGSVAIAAGASSATFTAHATNVSTAVTRLIQATLGSVTKTAILTIQPSPTLVLFTLDSYSVPGGDPIVGTVTLNSPAPPGHIQVLLDTNSGAIHPPYHVNVLEGETTGVFVATTDAVGATATRLMTASWLGVTKTVSVTLRRAVRLSTFTLTPNAVQGGSFITATVTLTAPAEDTKVISLADNTVSIETPNHMVVNAGQTAGEIQILTKPVNATATRYIQATADGITKTAIITLGSG